MPSTDTLHDLHPRGRPDEIARLKRQCPLLPYLLRHRWKGRPIGTARAEFVGLCPMHAETRPSFYVNSVKNLFYCHGCGQGGDLIRFAQLYFHLPFYAALTQLQQECGLVSPAASELLDQTAAFYQFQLHRSSEALQYLYQRGLRDGDLVDRLGIGYAPGGNLRRHLTALGHPLDRLLRAGLINHQGCDSFCRRVVFPCNQQGHCRNLYGRSIGAAHPHRFLPLPKPGLFAWETVRLFPTIILVEGLFDLALLWQHGFPNTTCFFGTHPSPAQWTELSDSADRQILVVFDSDANGAGPSAAFTLARRCARAGMTARIVSLPEGHDPNSYFLAGATRADCTSCLARAQKPTL
jgi:DNA primase